MCQTLGRLLKEIVGSLFKGTHNQDYSILGSILGSPVPFFQSLLGQT